MKNVLSLRHNVFFFEVYQPGNKTARLNDIGLGFYYTNTKMYNILLYTRWYYTMNTDDIIR